jgi:EAL domain-containing protein (putative c-di-GMP-specific phosphodiesterase class I)
VVAEGVQDRDTFDRLGDFGCDEAQGFYIAKAARAVGVLELVVAP